ncbi:formate--tetrahydrofolate ligase [Erysipelothrix urinaevulpis]|uniref:formate--tetrahydrofolate ligase n=1 Tax=Erysipelothrix urinaevulpis TaxID=2683717 RepID=UPI00135BE5A8|nr:formate--tetrahydrofolate ligase [Erysipelothrix urinaevulpis]
MKSDVELDQLMNLQAINEVAHKLGLDEDKLELYGPYKAKLDLDLLEGKQDGKLILMTSINPTPAGEGKTTMNIGLSMALNKIGVNAISALREPSLGPCFGMKGGATGGGYAQVHPMVDINMHFTGDFHAITSAHNLLAAMVDNHIFHGNELSIDPSRVQWNRVMDMNDRALRRIDLKNRTSKFDITVASEIMAILCLAENMSDLKARLGNILVAYTTDGKEVLASDLQAVGAMSVLLKDALRPNLVQTSEGGPALIHGGPFANIAHGCNSVIATKMGLNLADYVVTEAGFGADLGAEKFFDIKCRSANLQPDAVVLVATIKALKYHGGAKLKDLDKEDFDSLYRGLEHLQKHLYNLGMYGVPVVIALNRFQSDTDKEEAVLETFAKENHVRISFADVFTKGGDGSLDLAKQVVEVANEKSTFRLLYQDTNDLKKTIETIAHNIYGAKGVEFSKEALEELSNIKNQNLPVCIAKTQYSLSDDASLRNVPQDFDIHVKSCYLSQGAGFVVVLLGKVMTMPGLPKKPNAVGMDVLDDGTVIGLK